MKNRKSQISGTTIAYYFAAALVVLGLVFAIKEIGGFKKITPKIELANFITSLRNNIKLTAADSYESVKTPALSLPSAISSVCFVDRGKEADPFVNAKLAAELGIYKDENVFFEPFDKFAPFKIEQLSLDEKENPLCIKAANNKIKLKLTSKGNESLLTALKEEDKSIDCVSMLYNGGPDEKIDIVFLANGYGSIADFSSDANYYFNNFFLNTEPIKSNPAKFNFFRVDKFGDMGCAMQDYILCDEFKVKQLSSDCPNDYIFILTSRGKIADLVNPIRSSAVSNIIAINTEDTPLVLMHEFGHVFADLADEYVDESYYQNFEMESYPNCDDTPCPKWKIVTNGCFEGCSLNKFFRPTEDSIMRNYGSSDEFGPVNEKEIVKKLEVYSS